MNRTILLEPVGLDTSTCGYYGYEVVLYPQGCFVLPNSDKFQQEILAKLAEIDYDPGIDYLVVAGKLSKICLFVATVCNYYTPTVLLVYDERKQRYVNQQLLENNV